MAVTESRTEAGSSVADDPSAPGSGSSAGRRVAWRSLRFFASWIVALVLIGVALPRLVDVTWGGLFDVLGAVRVSALFILVGLWIGGLWLYSFTLRAAAPGLTHSRALILNLTGSALANAVPLGSFAGVELNRRMMKTWGVDIRAFTGYTFLTNLWNAGSKLILPLIGVGVLTGAGEVVAAQWWATSLISALAFVVLVIGAVVVLHSRRGLDRLGRGLERVARLGLRRVGRDRELGLPQTLDDIRRQSAGLVARGWAPMTAGTGGYVVLQGVLLGFCLHLTGAGVSWPAMMLGFAIERLLTVVPVTPGGIGLADLGLAGVLLTLGGNPAGVAAAVVLYRVFIFAIEIPVGGGVLGVWFLRWRSVAARPARDYGSVQRIAHVTDVFLPRLGGIETHVDDLVRHQRAAGSSAEVLTSTPGTGEDPSWVHRLSVWQARRAVTQYDAVHVHLSMWSLFGLGVARAAVAAGVPTVVTMHSVWVGGAGLLRVVTAAALRGRPVTWSAVSHVAANSFRRGRLEPEVAVLPNAIDLATWPPRQADPELPAGAPVRLVAVMRLTLRKRPLPLLRMLEQLRRLELRRDVELVFVGDGPSRRRIERYLVRHDLTQCVRLTGRIARPEVHAELQAGSIFVAPAPKESFGIAALEARCAGLPVVACRRSGVSQFIRDGVDGKLADGDAGFVAALAELIDDDELRTKIAQHNQTVKPGLDWSDVLPKTARLYRDAAERAEALAGNLSRPVPVAVGA